MVAVKKVVFSGLTKTESRILTEASRLAVASTNGLVCRETLMKKIGIKPNTLSVTLTKMRRNNNFPFAFVSKAGRRRQNVSVTVKVPTIYLEKTQEITCP
jgi:hypothetical protein